jgi:SAM-dependent methyltransferase
VTEPSHQRSLRSLTERAALRVLAAVQTPAPPVEEPVEVPVPEPEPTPPPDPARFVRELTPGRLACEQGLATELLHRRLSDTDIAAVEQLIKDTPGAWEHYGAAPEGAARRHVLLAFGVWLGAQNLVEKTGLTDAQPPEGIHVMARGPLSAAGGLYEADIVVDALTGAGVDMRDVRAGLDFGCSSGRVTRTLQAAYPDARWHGCDPNAPAIEWAAANLPGIEFFVNDNAPPLPLADGSLDMVYAISIWSHFAPGLGLGWFEEMHRLIRPGGHLVCTTHGLTSVAHSAANGRSEEQVEEILDSLYRQGSWYAPEFGEEGDWGVVNPDWGTAFLSPEWLLTHLCPRWRVLEFAPGRNQENQDVYVLQRV